MTQEDLKKKKREELTDMILAQEKEISNLTAELIEVRRKLRDRMICIEQCGTIAEASIAVNDVFQAAQAAADQYLENIKRVQKETEESCRSREEESLKQAENILREAREQADKVMQKATAAAKEVTEQALEFSKEKTRAAELLLKKAEQDSEGIREAAVKYFVEKSNARHAQNGSENE